MVEVRDFAWSLGISAATVYLTLGLAWFNYVIVVQYLYPARCFLSSFTLRLCAKRKCFARPTVSIGVYSLKLSGITFNKTTLLPRKKYED